MPQKFKIKLQGRGPGRAWTSLPIPFDVKKVFGSKARVPVKGTANGFAFRNFLMPEGNGKHCMMFNKILQAGAKAKAGDTVTVVIEVDGAPHTVTIPPGLKKAFTELLECKMAFSRFSYTHQKDFVNWITEAKRPETRAKRIERCLQLLDAGKRLRD
jgi:hypothetical protein